MITIEEKTYSCIAQKLIEALNPENDMFNGALEYDTDEFCSTLKCTLIVKHKNIDEPTGNISIIQSITPVWWEFITAHDGAICNNDFSWRELVSFLDI